MGPTEINGLAAHVLLVHVVVVFVPLASLLLILSAFWPAARRGLGVIMPIVALDALASIPPTTNAGSWLIKRWIVHLGMPNTRTSPTPCCVGDRVARGFLVGVGRLREAALAAAAAR